VTTSIVTSKSSFTSQDRQVVSSCTHINEFLVP